MRVRVSGHRVGTTLGLPSNPTAIAARASTRLAALMSPDAFGPLTIERT